MYRGSFISAMQRLDRRRQIAAVGVLLGIVFVFSVLSVELRLPGFSTAPWWPAAGFAAVAVLASRGRGVAIAGLVLIVTAVANAAVGTTWWVALGFGLGNAAEAWIIAAVLRVRRDGDRPFGVLDSLRFLAATGGGAVAIGVVAGGFVALEGGPFLATAVHVAASHASAVLVITGLAVLPRRAFRVDRPVEFVAQLLVLAATVGFAFAPEQRFPLAFLPLPILAWAAFRFGSGVVLAEIALCGAAILGFAVVGGGPFIDAAAGDPALLIGLVQIYTIALIASLVPLALLQDGQAMLLSRLSAREKLLSGVIVNAHAGFVVVRRVDREFRILESNGTGMRLLAAWIHPSREGAVLDHDELSAVIPARPGDDWIGEREFADGLLLELVVTRVAGERELFLIQAIDATEQRAASRALHDALQHERDALERLRDLAAQKDEFVSSVSHELRTPVTSILGYAEDLAETSSSGADRRSIEVILRNARRLAELVDDLLSLSRVGEPAPVATVPVDLVRALAEGHDELAPLARAAGVTVTVEVPTGLTVAGDPLAIDRVVVNLLGNAIKFTPEGGTVAVSAADTGSGTVHIRIADTGRGIPSGELERVFERFYRIADPDRGFVPGTGLGLPIVRDLVTRMGGSVTLESDGRHGTTAVVELPAAVGVGGPA